MQSDPLPSDYPPTFVGVDFGGRRIGIAVSTSGLLATPHSVLLNEGDVLAKVAGVGEELGATVFVVGIPRRQGSATEQKYRAMAEALRQQTCKEVVLWDESLTTIEASQTLRAAGRSRREAQKEIDMHAAAAILQSYLDDRAGRQP